MKIYTRKGDRGHTTLVGGKPVSKTHIRIEAYGTVDELMAHTALLCDQLTDGPGSEYLPEIQDRLMTCASILAADCDDCEVVIPTLREEDVSSLEKEIDRMEAELPRLTSFILPGGHTPGSQAHVCRTVCRRAEREIIRVTAELFVPEIVIKYINRLSDYFFVLSRKILHDAGFEDTPWKPRL